MTQITDLNLNEKNNRTSQISNGCKSKQCFNIYHLVNLYLVSNFSNDKMKKEGNNFVSFFSFW